MVITKRMKSARMNQSCCWNGGASGGLVGRQVKVMKLIKTRSQVVGELLITLTCPIGQNDCPDNTVYYFYNDKVISVRSDGAKRTDPVSNVVVTENSVTFKSKTEGCKRITFNDDKEIIDFDDIPC